MGSYMHSKKLQIFPAIPDLLYNMYFDSDSYKTSHWMFYQDDTTYMHSYFESRGGEYQNTLFFGLQYILHKYLSKKPTMELLQEFMEFMKYHGPTLNEKGMRKIAELGYWPVRIRAVKEGTLVPVSNVLMTAESTDPELFWVANYLEGMLQRGVWGPTTVATKSWHARKIGEEFYNLTNGNTDGIQFMLQDFGSRGVSTYEGTENLAGAHLVNFQGSDTMAAARWFKHYYPDASVRCAAFSVNATEHSNMTSWGGPMHEIDAIRNAIEKAPVGSVLSVVTDSYDQMDTVSNKIVSLKDRIIQKDLSFVSRLDSGKPTLTVPEASEMLAERIGFTMTQKGYKQIAHKFKVLQGDGMDVPMIRTLFKACTDKGFAATNYVWGMGGGLLQDMTRDNQKFATKCSEVITGGKHIDVFKDPVTDPVKRSKAGHLDLQIRDGKYETVRYPAQFGSQLDLVFEDGKIYRQHGISEVRNRAWNGAF